MTTTILLESINDEVLNNLYKKTSFNEGNIEFGNSDKGSGIHILGDPEEGFHPYIGECEYMGSVTIDNSTEYGGNDVLFIQTLI